MLMLGCVNSVVAADNVDAGVCVNSVVAADNGYGHQSGLMTNMPTLQSVCSSCSCSLCSPLIMAMDDHDR